ncbi:RHS repeat-associated core domain-containing protein, partial [Candidatus Peregrinibacteria bacterium]|nr:RHS repeat-associated core domain-containing protein [Candidatus Peregrinibacteria bacterium]
QERDEETDLYYYGARYYNPDIGRFTSLDPWSGDIKDPQSLNKYSYVRNNPLKYVDPSGEIVEVAAKDLELTDIIGSHSYLIITPLEPDNFQAYLAEGETSFTIGGFGVDDKLVGIINAKTDIKDLSSPRVQDHDVVDNPFGDNNDSGSDIEFINSILEIHNNAPEMDYNFASFNLNGRNCHNYTTSLIEGAGAEIPSDFKPTGLHPGLGESIPTMIDNSSTSSNNTDNPTNNANESDQGLWDKFKSLF